MKFFKFMTHTSLLLLLAISSSSHAQNFYKWVDKNGSTHYTLTPPPKNAKKQGRVFTINDTPSGSQYRPPATAVENTTPTTPTTTETTPTQTVENMPAIEPTVPTTTNTTVKKGEHLALPPRIADPTSGQYVPLR